MPKIDARRGRRPGASITSDAIRKHAALAFTAAGYDGVTVREIAARAGVDPSLVFHYFGSKRALFEASLVMPDLDTVAPIDTKPKVTASATNAAGGSIGERIVSDFLSRWDAPSARVTLSGLLRSASTDSQARMQLTDLIERTIVAPAIASIDARRGMAKLRAALVAAQLLGIAWTRYVLELQPVSSASPSIVGRTFGPSIDSTLRGTDYGRGG